MKQNSPAVRARLPLQALASLSVLCSIATTSQAQTPVQPQPAPRFGIGDALKETQPPAPPPRKPPPPLQIERQDQRPLNLPAGDVLQVQSFRFEGADLIVEQELQAALAPYRGRALTMAEIEEAAGRVTALYRDRGYMVARAYVPRQDAQNGVLTIRILIGKFGQVTLKNQSLVRDSVLRQAFSPLRDGVAVSQASLERTMLVVGDMPGAQLPRLTISPGQAQGLSDFEVDIDAGPRIAGSVGLDNLDSEYTGKYRLSAGLEINSPFGLADKLSLNMMGGRDSQLLNGRLAYAFPILGDGLRAEVAAAQTTYELGGAYADLGATGKARSLEGRLSYPLLRSQQQNLYVNLNLSARRLRDEIALSQSVNPKKVRVGSLGAQYDAWGEVAGRAAFSTLGATVTYGHLDITDPALAAQNRAGADTVGNYGHVNFDATTSIELTPHWKLNAGLSAQKALGGKNLDSSEQMSISGRSGVKAYREAVSGDNAYLANVEVRYALPSWSGLTQALGVFTDIGRVHLQNGSYTTSNGTRLSDAGLGYYASRQALFGQLQFAHGVGSRPPGASGKTRVLAQLGMVF
ncbi:MAG: ShlB/FhaC/HecB family hemolysin secretion/activation protein [Pseudomonadota bacterium]